MILRVFAVMCIFILGCSPQQMANRNSGSGITYSGGTGESFHEAIIISGAKNKSDGVSAEYRFISDQHGRRGNKWLLVEQTVIREKNKVVDVIEIQLNNASFDRLIFYFDVTDFILKRR